VFYSSWEREIEHYNLTYYELNFIFLEVLGRSYEDVKLKGLSPLEMEKLKPFLEQAKSMPVEYIFRKAFFRNLELYVDERVLIPRNETEQLVDIVLNILKKSSDRSILEVGTGSGAIAISLALEAGLRVFASDVSFPALQVARVNVKNYGLEDRIFLFVSDGLKGVKKGWDLIVWNFPYVLPEEYPHLPEKVKVEPAIALISTPRKLLKFMEEALPHLNTGGYIVLELSPQFIDALKKKYTEAIIEKDLYGAERFAILRKQ